MLGRIFHCVDKTVYTLRLLEITRADVSYNAKSSFVGTSSNGIVIV